MFEEWHRSWRTDGPGEASADWFGGIGVPAMALGIVGMLCCVGAGILGFVLSAEMLSSSVAFFGIGWLWVGLAAATYACWHCLRVGQALRTRAQGVSRSTDAETLGAVEKTLWGVSASVAYLLVSAATFWMLVT